MAAELTKDIKAEAIQWFQEHTWRRVPIHEYPPARVRALLAQGMAGVWMPCDILMGGWKR